MKSKHEYEYCLPNNHGRFEHAKSLLLGAEKNVAAFYKQVEVGSDFLNNVLSSKGWFFGYNLATKRKVGSAVKTDVQRNSRASQR